MHTLKTLVLGLALMMGSQGWAQKVTISGTIKDASNGETLLGVNVIEPIRRLGTTTNTYGFYSITVPAGEIQLAYSYIGYKTQRMTFNASKDTTIHLEMAIAEEMLAEVVLTAEESIQEKVEMSVIDVPVQQIQKLPALMGEVDVLKTLQLLPGVQSGGEGTSGIYVRGGSPDQNLILLDGVPVYNASHLFGFFSVFNSDAIKNVKLTKGGFPARFGGRLSSVLEIDMKEGNIKDFEGSASIGLISSKLTLEGPIGKKEKTSYIVSARRTYIDALAQPFIMAFTQGNRFGYYFGDLNAKINHQINDKDRIFVSAYGGIDRFYVKYDYADSQEEYSERIGLDWGNATTAVRWNRLISSKLFGNLTATFSRYQFSVNSESKNRDIIADTNMYYLELKYLSDIRDWGAKYDLEYLPNPNHTIRTGINYTFHHFRPGALVAEEEYQGESTEMEQLFSQPVYSHDAFIYLEDEWEVSPRLKVNYGLHQSLYTSRGATYHQLQPRASARYLLTDEWAFKASYAKMQQYLHLLTSSGSGLPTDIWVSSTDRTPPQNSWQVAVGVSRMLLNDAFEFSVEAYYKEMDNLITYLPGEGFTGSEDWEDKVISGGLGTSYGVEWFVQKKKGNTTGWIGYTWSKSDRHFPNTVINNGQPYPFRYDRRHDFSFVLVHKINDHIDLSGTWVYSTGNVVTLYESQYNTPDWNTVQHYPSKNNFRLPSYHRMDISLQFHKQKKKGVRTWALSVYNLYNRANPFFVMFDNYYNGTWNDKRALVQYSLFPVLPSVSYSFKF